MGNSKSSQKVEKATEVEYSSGFHVVELHFPSTGPGLLLLFLIVAGIVCCMCLCRRRSSFFRSRRQRDHPMFPMVYPLPQPMLAPPIPAYASTPLPTSPPPWGTYESLQRPTPTISVARAIDNAQVTEVTDTDDKAVSKENKCSHTWKNELSRLS